MPLCLFILLVCLSFLPPPCSPSPHTHTKKKHYQLTFKLQPKRVKTVKQKNGKINTEGFYPQRLVSIKALYIPNGFVKTFLTKHACMHQYFGTSYLTWVLGAPSRSSPRMIISDPGSVFELEFPALHFSVRWMCSVICKVSETKRNITKLIEIKTTVKKHETKINEKKTEWNEMRRNEIEQTKIQEAKENKM